MRYANKNEVELNVPPSVVWQQITDFKSFPEWNPMIPAMAGELAEGAKLKGKAQVGPLKAPFQAKLTTLRPNEELRWAGGVPGVMVADHRFIIDDLGNGRSVLRHHEEFTGVAATNLTVKIANDTHARFNAALKKRIESER
ncbi:MAG: SRPBCC family protein [Solirubrobacterales bacterium]